MPTSANSYLAGAVPLDYGNDDGSVLRDPVATTSSILSSSSSLGVGYSTGSGGAVTQITSRATAVTIATICGQITTDTTSLAAEASAKFTVTNSSMAEADVVVLSFRDAVALNTNCVVTDTAAGSFEITVINGNVAAGTAETGAIIINYAIIKAVAA